MTKEDMMKAVKWAVWAACNIGHDQFSELLKKMLGDVNLVPSYIDEQWGKMRNNPGFWLVDLDEKAQTVFCEFALEKYQK